MKVVRVNGLKVKDYEAVIVVMKMVVCGCG